MTQEAEVTQLLLEGSVVMQVKGGKEITPERKQY